MPDLWIDAIAVAVCERPDYRPAATVPPDDPTAPLVRGVAAFGGVPAERLWMLTPDGAGPEEDVAARALAALGRPSQRQTLFYVRSGPPRDPAVAALARLVHESGWAGDDVGITHLDELGGCLVAELLGWAVPPAGAATVVICDEPLFATDRPGRLAAVGLRVRRADLYGADPYGADPYGAGLYGAGPQRAVARVLGCGEGPPVERPRSGPATGVLRGARPCDAWLELHTALVSGRIGDGDEVLLHTRGEHREGWVAVEVRGARPPAVVVGGLARAGSAAS